MKTVTVIETRKQIGRGIRINRVSFPVYSEFAEPRNVEREKAANVERYAAKIAMGETLFEGGETE